MIVLEIAIPLVFLALMSCLSAVPLAYLALFIEVRHKKLVESGSRHSFSCALLLSLFMASVVLAVSFFFAQYWKHFLAL